MENILLDDEFEYKTINNIKGLVFKINYPTIKIKNQPKIKKWIEFQKMERGNNGYVSYCKKCHLFFYFLNEKEEKETKNKCCDDYDFGKICNYCGEIYFDNSLCCLINGIIRALKITLFDEKYVFSDDIFDKIKLIPFIFIFIFSVSIIFGIFGNRRKTINNNIFSSFSDRDNCQIGTFFIIVLLLVLLHSLIFIVPLLILYLFFFIFILIQKCKKKNKNIESDFKY